MSDLAKLFAENLGALPHPSGNPVRLAEFDTGTLPPGLREQVAEEHGKTRTAIGEALENLMTSNGISTVSTARLEELLTKERAFDGVRPPQGTLVCPACGEATATVNITNPNRIPASTATLQKLKCKCP